MEILSSNSETQRMVTSVSLSPDQRGDCFTDCLNMMLDRKCHFCARDLGVICNHFEDLFLKEKKELW